MFYKYFANIQLFLAIIYLMAQKFTEPPVGQYLAGVFVWHGFCILWV